MHQLNRYILTVLLPAESRAAAAAEDRLWKSMCAEFIRTCVLLLQSRWNKSSDDFSRSTKMGNGLSDHRFPCLPSFQALHIVILGLDCAGKTTVLYRLRFNEFVNTVPTKGFNTEKIKVTLGGGRRTASFHFWDVGGQEKLRPLWRSYTRCADGIVFVVDSVDAERVEEAKTELHKITRLAENQGVPVLVVANKQDLRNSLSLAEMESTLALGELGAATPWHLQPACAIIGEGLQEGLEKLHAMIVKRRKMLRQQKKKKR
ncbi:ADP-ribosylation factor-like protein 4A isoform X1 [Sebastes umbrosus]|uniref:ADP-ribosylation factor-like protein 4A isoform X1 n=2 Tax=Sebastes umbrosus TaxID=72105 RepID=UPI00189E60E5|nr:ADP-ribosylation factor-like protein 4A isoform X1 [Sebastes umbrosus]